MRAQARPSQQYLQATTGSKPLVGKSFVSSGTVPLDTGTGDQQYPDAAGNPADGAYLAVWQSSSLMADANIYVRLVYSDGAYGARQDVYTGPYDQEYPAVAYGTVIGANGRSPQYLVVWAHNNGSDDDVRGRVVAANGEPVGSEITITAAAAEEQYPAVAANGAGGYIVAWQEGATNSDIAAAVVDGTGQVLGGGVEARRLKSAGRGRCAPGVALRRRCPHLGPFASPEAVVVRWFRWRLASCT